MRRQVSTVVFNDRERPGIRRLGVEFDWGAQPPRPAQFVMLSFPGRLDPLLPRPFSVSDAYVEGGRRILEFLYKPVGPATTLMAELAPGHRVAVLGLLGNGFPEPALGARPVLLAGGIGNAPFALQIRRLAAGAHGPRDVVLFLAGRTRGDVYIQERARAAGITVVEVTDDGSLGERGLITEALGRRLRSLGRIEAFACGPTPMLRAVRKMAIEEGFRCHLSVEETMACGYGVCNACVIPSSAEPGCYLRSCTQGPVFEASEIDP
jgi:dihydroorotate dehydrogenase electron transfer subunit